MLNAGTRLGPYELQDLIGSGGMGEVYRARDTRLDRTVAVKVLLPGLAGAPEFRERFEREARAISQLSHPHICTLYDVGAAVPSDAPASLPVSFLVMELIEGETLAARIARGALPPDQAMTFAVQIADALDRAHRTGIVHGDLKPGNVMVGRAGIKLLDFGLAAHVPPPPGGAWTEDRTQTMAVGGESVLGTLQYLAPEQLDGRSPDVRSDVFACGAVIFEMLTGRKCFDGHSQAAVIAAVMRHDTPAVSSLQPLASAALDHIVATCLAKDPDDRWQHAGDLMRALKGVAGVPGRGGVPSPEPASAAPPSRRLWWGVAAGLVAAAVVFSAAWLLRAPVTPRLVTRTSILLPEGLRFPVAVTVGGAGRFAISPDGRQLAFVATDPRGNQMLWLRPLDALAARLLPGTDGAASPFWSPDSRSVGFFAAGQLKTMAIDGAATPAVVAEPAFSGTGSWNRDNVILFSPAPASALHRVSASGGTVTPVTALDKAAGDVLHRNPFFLPDGNHFLYVAVAARDGNATGPRAMYVGSLSNGEPARLLSESGASARYADGHLLFVRENTLLAQPFDLASLALTGEAVPVAEPVELVGSSSAAFSVSDTGMLVYQPVDRGSQLVWVDREGRQLAAVGEPAEYGDVELSPDGRRAVVSVLDAATNTRDLWMIDTERGARTRFTFDPGDDVVPAWSTDGSRILFASNRRGHFDLYEKQAGGMSPETPIYEDGTEKYPTSWAPDGASAMFWSFDPEGARLSILPMTDAQEGRRPAPFLEGFANAGRISPDGRWVTYYSAESGRPEVYVVPFPAPSARWQVSITGGSLPRWRADGKELFYAGRDNRLMAVPVAVTPDGFDVGPARPLFDARPVGPRAFYAVSPDGQRFLVNSVRGDAQSSITVVQNWRAAVRP